MKSFDLTACILFFASGALFAGTPPPPQHPLVPDGSFRTLMPGFVVTPLPVKLTNMNNVAYGPDGRLYAAGYNGVVHVLSDSDGDGIEDRAEVFWNKPNDILCPLGMVVNKNGVFICTQGRIARLRDTTGDGIADECVTVASGWSAKVPGYLNRRVDDCIGLAIDGDGNFYIGLGTPNYENPYVLTKDEKKTPQYDLKNPRGTLLKITPDGKQEILATGLRFTVGIEINRHGDLFVTDQEGSTWLPTGNPYDELVHIVKGRHYGFPPRHPDYLPNVFDEPSTLDFGPTHQSTCGFRFNEVKAGQKTFGPPGFADNAFVTAMSRGKLYRAPVVKTAFGYVAQQTLFATMGVLPVDVTFSADGQMVVAAHSGRPDWGNGPNAQGTLFKVRASSEKVPVPAAVWASSPFEVNVAFSAPVEPAQVAHLAIVGGQYVREADHLEPFRPGYAVVKREQQAPRHTLAVLSSQLSDDKRLLRIRTAPHPWRATYALTMAATSEPLKARESFEVAYDFHGVEAQWFKAGSNEAAWSGWLPHLDLDASRGLTAGSSTHAALWELLKQPGNLVLKTALSSTWKKTVVLLDVSGTSKTIRLDGKTLDLAQKRTEFELPPCGGLLELAVGTGPELALSAGFRCESDARERPLFLYQQAVTWAPQTTPPPPAEKLVEDPQWAGGDPVKGRAIYFGEAKCSACHAIHGEGGSVGPDLTNQFSRHREAILRDIAEPNATMNPDYLAYLVALKDGRRLEGTLQTFGTEKIKVMDATGVGTEILMADVKTIRQSRLSLMPEGFKDLGPEKLRDLLAYLTAKKE